jgi:hypothetical protein
MVYVLAPIIVCCSLVASAACLFVAILHVREVTR